MYELPRIDIQGTPADMGRQYGEAVADHVHSMLENRLREAEGYFSERGVSNGVDQMQATGSAMIEALAAWDKAGCEELVATAEGAGVEPSLLIAVINVTDTRDLVHFGSTGADEGCTSLMIPPAFSAGGQVLAAQTWDLNCTDLPNVVCVHRRPESGPATVAITIAGGPTILGMNEHGLWVGTTNLKTRDVRMGIAYTNLLHRAIRERTHADAAGVIAGADRMAAHTFWLADEHGGTQLETTSTTCITRVMDDQPIVQTNHCLAQGHVDAEPPSESSQHRCRRAEDLLAGGQHDVDSIRRLLADRSEGLLSISRHPDDEDPSATIACVIGVPGARRFHACRGPSDQGTWVDLSPCS